MELAADERYVRNYILNEYGFDILDETECIAQLRRNPNIFSCIPYRLQTDEMCRTVLHKNGMQIVNVRNPISDDLWQIAVSANPEAVVFHDNPSPELIALAQKRRPDIITFMEEVKNCVAEWGQKK